MLLSLFFIVVLSDPTSPPPPSVTPLPTGKFIGLLFACAAGAAVVMIIIGIIALRIMKQPPSDERDVKAPLIPEQ